MALTTTQVNQAFLATLGRPAEGSAATWGSTSLSLGALSDSIFIAENTDDFVESLYTEILGRASDAEGKAFWNSLLATTSKEAVLAQFKAAVIAAGQADPANADYQSFIAQNKAFVTELYTNLLGRSDAASADAEGVEFWANALASGTSKGALLAQFTAAALSDPNSDDAQTLNAKVNVANAITAKFNNFNADVAADQKKAALDELKATMTEVVAGSTAEDFQERIDTFAGNYQNRVAQVFTTKDDDQLDASEATASTVFSGNVNLIDPAKGTIQSGDSVTGNSNYTDTLRVSVTSDSANKDFSLGTNLPTSVSSIEKLIITAGAANVSGTLDGTNYAESATITSTGDVDLKIRGVQKELKVTAGDKKDAAITVESDSLNNYTGSAAKDTINVKAGSVKTIDTGAGKDVVTIASGAKIENEGSIKLGAGDDELTIESTLLAKTDTLNKISLDGGEGSKDKLTISTDITAVNSITGFETITATGTATISADAANSLTSGTKLSNGSNLKIDMVDKNSLNLKNLKVGNTTDNKPGKAAVDVLNVAKGEITLTSTTKNAIVETITLAKTTNDGKTGTVTIKGIGAAELDGERKKADTFGDKLKIAETTINETLVKLNASSDTRQPLTANSLHYVNTKISSADDLASKGTVLDLKLSLADGNKALVALNNSAQNKSYIYEITGNTAGLTRDNITLKAIVDNAINTYDQVSGNTIEFVAGVERDVAPAVGDTANVLTFDNASGDITLAANGTYKNAKIDNTKTAISINGVDAAITLKGEKGSIATANIFAKDGAGAAADLTNTAGVTTANLFIGGTTTKFDASEITKTTDKITLTGIGNNYSNDTIKVYTTSVDFTALTVLSTKKLDLGAKEGASDINTIVDITTAVTATTDFSAKLENGNAGDTVKIKIGNPDASQTFTLTTASDEVTLSAKATTNKVATIENFKASGNDKLNIAVYKQSGATNEWTTLSTGKVDVEATKTYFKADSSKSISQVETSTFDYIKALFNDKSGAGTPKATVVIQANDGLGIYEVTDGATGSDLSVTKALELTGITNATTSDLLLG